jgi:hypothetical protein
MSYIADDAVTNTPTGVHTGKEEVQKGLEDMVQDGFSFKLGRQFEDEDGRVSYAYLMLQNDEAAMSLTNGVTIVKNGKIIFDGDEMNEAAWLKAKSAPAAGE